MTTRDKTVKLLFEGNARALVTIPRLRLRVIEGADAEATVDLSETVTLGRDVSCDLVLSDASVSGVHARIHARIQARGADFWLEDLQSTNGCKLNGVAVGSGNIQAGDRLSVGNTRIAVEERQRDLIVSPDDSCSLGPLVGQSEQMRLLFGIIRVIAPTELNVLIQGETGTGKELIARAIHECSTRGSGPLVIADSTCLSGDLVASELFGHELGSFTGAERRHKGAFERADGGTLFLDEVGELSSNAQARLLRVLETRSFTRIGGETPLTVDVRVIAATHCDLASMIEEGRFRSDLYYRLDEVNITAPPLRERPEDIPPLVEHLREQLATRIGSTTKGIGFSPAAMQAMASHAWPGNVRELKNFVAKNFAMKQSGMIDVHDLLPFRKSSVRRAVSSSSSFPGDRAEAVSPILVKRKVDPDEIRRLLAAYGGNKAAVARELGIPVTTLRYRLKRIGLDDNE